MSAAGTQRGGHSVIAVPVPALEQVVRERTARYDASFLSADPAFTHAHITLLGPWLADPTEKDLLMVAEVLANEEPFAFELAEVRQFADGIVHLAPDPADPFSRLTARLAEAFPQTPPYEGRYSEILPHLTLEHSSTGATAASVAAELGARLPVRALADQVDLQWWANDDCHVRRTWRLGR